MRAIIIGAGRGRRLMPTTADAPKCFAEVQGKRLLDWALQALSGAGIGDICFIGGYQIDKVRAGYPRFTFRHNTDWENNNILASLMYAEDLMDEPFVCTYSDTLFTADVVKRVLANPADIALSVDTRWLDRYEHRSDHPPIDAEKVTAANGLVTRVHRGIAPSAAHGEYTGIAKFSQRGAAQLKEHYHRCKALLRRQAVPRSRRVRKGLSHSPVAGHDRSRRRRWRMPIRPATTSKSTPSRISSSRKIPGAADHGEAAFPGLRRRLDAALSIRSGSHQRQAAAVAGAIRGGDGRGGPLHRRRAGACRPRRDHRRRVAAQVLHRRHRRARAWIRA